MYYFRKKKKSEIFQKLVLISHLSVSNESINFWACIQHVYCFEF